MDQAKEYIEYEALRKFVNIGDSDTFRVYLREIYKDISERFESNKKQGISKLAFYDYLKLPIFIAEKLFTSMDLDGNGFLDVNEFTKGLGKLYDGTFEETATEIFNIYDFNKNGRIYAGDVKVLLSYLPLKTDQVKNEYLYQMESLDEIDDILKQTFGNKEFLELPDYLKVIESTKSDIYLQLLCFLYQKKPFTDENVESFSKLPTKRASSKKQISLTHEIRAQGTKNLISPSKKTRFAPVDDMFTISMMPVMGITDEEDESKIELEFQKGLEKSGKAEVKEKDKDKRRSSNSNTNENEIVSGFKGMIRMPNRKKIDQTSKPAVNETNPPEFIKKSKNFLQTPSNFLVSKEEKLEEYSLDLGFNSRRRASEKTSQIKISYENWIYKLGENNTKLKKYWLVIMGKDMFYYTTQEKNVLEGVHNLTSIFVKEQPETTILGQKVFPLCLTFQPKSRTFYCLDKDSQTIWVQKISEAIGYLNFFDYYEMIDDIGTGKFGQVKLGMHKSTKKRVAIKIMNKSEMSNSDIELVKGELDIMMICVHPNIIQLLDHFENLDYIFIVMELVLGGDLGEFIVKRKAKISEEIIAKIMFQIAAGLDYLHRYGIVHRDLKPENIMLMNDDINNPSIKIMDFGLSKIMGPNEKAEEGYGTLTFVAPEVLVREPYNKKVDIWSLGIIMYFSLCCCLPFDDPTDNEDNIAKLIVYEPPDFAEEIWKSRSEESKDLIRLCLAKKPEDRIDADIFLKHKWVKKYCK